MKYWLSLVLLYCLATFATSPTSAALGQESIGFADPNDLETLLAYRLPDWGYRVWDLRGNLSGDGYESSRTTRSFDLNLDSDLGMYGESEARIWNFSASLGGGFLRRELEDENDWINSHAIDLQGGLQVGGNMRHYIRPNVALVLGTHIAVDYSERREVKGTSRANRVQRHYFQDIQAGIGLGRLRDVTPLLRAQRLSERLVALGRRPLQRPDVLHLAEVLARENGYRTVFQRSQKAFWGDVFAPIEAESPLTPYEVLYLTDVLVEQIGQRRQGLQVTLTAVASRNSYSYSDNSHAGSELSLIWSRNLNLERQVSMQLSGYYRWRVDDPGDDELGYLQLKLSHLWAMADRVIWTTDLRNIFSYQENKASGGLLYRSFLAELFSSFDLFVEDRVSLKPFLGLAYGTNYYSYLRYGTTERWQWSVGASLNYALDKILY